MSPVRKSGSSTVSRRGVACSKSPVTRMRGKPVKMLTGPGLASDRSGCSQHDQGPSTWGREELVDHRYSFGAVVWGKGCECRPPAYHEEVLPGCDVCQQRFLILGLGSAAISARNDADSFNRARRRKGSAKSRRFRDRRRREHLSAGDLGLASAADRTASSKSCAGI